MCAADVAPAGRDRGADGPQAAAGGATDQPQLGVIGAETAEPTTGAALDGLLDTALTRRVVVPSTASCV